MRAASLPDTKTISSRWTWYGNVFSSVVIKLSGAAVLLEFETISNCWTWYGTDTSFPFFCHQTIRVAVLLEFQTISSC